MRYFKFTFSLFFIVNLAFSQNIKDPLLSEDSNAQQKWVDSTYNTLTLKEKVGHLFINKFTRISVKYSLNH